MQTLPFMHKQFTMPDNEIVDAAKQWHAKLLPDDIARTGWQGSLDNPADAAQFITKAWQTVPLTTADIAETLEHMEHARNGKPAKKEPAFKQLSIVDGHMLRQDAQFMEKVYGIRVKELKDGMSDVHMEVPVFLTDKALVKRYMDAIFPGIEYKHSSPTQQRDVTISLYDFKDASRRMRKPLTERALPGVEEGDRKILEEEFKRMIGQEIRPENKELEKATLSEAIRELRIRKHVPFQEFWRDGVLHLPVKDAESTLFKIADYGRTHGQLAPDDIAITKTDKDGAKFDIALTPRGLHKLNTLALEGVKAKEGNGMELASVLDASSVALRNAFKEEKRIEKAVAVMHEALPAYVAKSPVAGKTYDKQQMQDALSSAFAMLDENRYWQVLEKSQMASHGNPIRVELREALGDLNTILKTRDVSQDEMRWLVNESPYAVPLRTTGHLMSVVQDDPKKKGLDNGTHKFQEAFGLTRLSMTPDDAEAKDASYFLRAEQGQVSFAERVKNNAFNGLKPIKHSVDLAFEKPLLVGGAVAAVAAYSQAVPKKYSIPALINKVMHDTMEGLGLHSHERGSDVFKLTNKVKMVEANQPFATKAAFKSGWAACAGSFGIGFIMFNLVEDVIVHMPLALVSVAVGAAGGATGRKVVKPIIDDLGDLAGRYAPEPVRQAVMDDYKAAKRIFDNSPFASAKDGFVAFARDVDELGVVASSLGALQKTQRWADKVKISAHHEQTQHPTGKM